VVPIPAPFADVGAQVINAIAVGSEAANRRRMREGVAADRCRQVSDVRRRRPLRAPGINALYFPGSIDRQPIAFFRQAHRPAPLQVETQTILVGLADAALLPFLFGEPLAKGGGIV